MHTITLSTAKIPASSSCLLNSLLTFNPLKVGRKKKPLHDDLSSPCRSQRVFTFAIWSLTFWMKPRVKFRVNTTKVPNFSVQALNKCFSFSVCWITLPNTQNYSAQPIWTLYNKDMVWISKLFLWLFFHKKIFLKFKVAKWLHLKVLPHWEDKGGSKSIFFSSENFAFISYITEDAEISSCIRDNEAEHNTAPRHSSFSLIRYQLKKQNKKPVSIFCEVL